MASHDPSTVSARRPGLAAHWSLDPGIVFLNHGSFGACPTAVLEAQSRTRGRLESEPVRFLVREYYELLDGARAALGAFLDADPEELAFVPNATTAVNAVLRSLRFAPGDEILTTDHVYNACRNAAVETAAAAGAGVVIASLPFPIESEDAAAARIIGRITPRTKLILLDHVTSPTGIILPVGPIVDAAAARGIDVLVDGAHAPGMIPLSLRAWPRAFYAGNLHKWTCAPKGAGFLRVPLHRQPEIRPHVISHGANTPPVRRSRFRLEFDWTGTVDPTPYLAVPDALRFLGGLLPGGWPELMARNRRLALEARDILCAALQVAPPAPDSMIGSLAAVPIPAARSAAAPDAFSTDPLQDALFEEHGIEVPIVTWPGPGRRLVRISAQLYNERSHYERLAAALRELLARGL